jgi:hypothetical protein
MALPGGVPEPVGVSSYITNGGNVTNGANVNVALPAVAGKTNWITGFDISGSGATAASQIDVTITGLSGGTAHYGFTIPAGVNLAAPLGAGGPVVGVRFPAPGLPANAANQAITLIVPGFGSGNLETSATVYGYVS